MIRSGNLFSGKGSKELLLLFYQVAEPWSC
ncbi:hypothetical protein DESME_06930 [Desulfitobacterium metallireducens DSM 15288]|uniref:Uncharacterized protein n=1 Tax=Desulfitobacterium metallireducens DSM 15288 TaxID=871968 RepID=W0ECN6_9FIRM|nr:hypothetical protein DESME_06930 [Desulfitobacterium metallireducens DSM 15288]